MNVPCKRVQLLDCDPDNDLDCDLDRDPVNFASCKRGIRSISYMKSYKIKSKDGHIFLEALFHCIFQVRNC